MIAARLHEFNRSPADIVRIVKVHESTLRKRYNFFFLPIINFSIFLNKIELLLTLGKINLIKNKIKFLTISSLSVTRLIEFGETPSSALTLDEFMNVDLEEEQDPPSFKMARKRDKERLQKV